MKSDSGYYAVKIEEFRNYLQMHNAMLLRRKKKNNLLDYHSFHNINSESLFSTTPMPQLSGTLTCIYCIANLSAPCSLSPAEGGVT